jgi:hypothetical protein
MFVILERRKLYADGLCRRAQAISSPDRLHLSLSRPSGLSLLFKSLDHASKNRPNFLDFMQCDMYLPDIPGNFLRIMLRASRTLCLAYFGCEPASSIRDQTWFKKPCAPFETPHELYVINCERSARRIYNLRRREFGFRP